jgi:uncharacterized membrane protein YdbT with pleckstrin-like domain
MADNYLLRLLGEKESVLYIARQHWLVLIISILPEVTLFILMLFAIIFSVLSFQIVGLWFAAILLLLPIISLIRDTLIWWNRQYVITNRRVIQINGVINKDVIDSSLEKVNDVKLVQSFWGRILSYGNIEIMTASELGANTFTRISDPIKFKTTMLDAKEKEENQVGEMIVQGMKTASIPEMIEKVGDLRTKGLISEEEFQLKKSELLSKITK